MKSGMYMNGTDLYISDIVSKIHFMCDDKKAKEIMEAVRLAVKCPLNDSNPHYVQDNSEDTYSNLIGQGYVSAGDVEGGVLLVGYPSLDIKGRKVICFIYLPTEMSRVNKPKYVTIQMQA